MSEKYLAKVKKEENAFVVKIPSEVAQDVSIDAGSYIYVSVEKPKEYIVELDRSVIEELKRMKEKWAQYKDKDINEILKDMMIKFNAKSTEKKEDIPDKQIKIVEKDTL
ncbi:MAG: hypothetical protein ACLFPQ_03895 [Candidatus Woesearchaeota archaeon]